MIQKRVTLKNETYIINSSEKTQRMRLYFQIRKKFSNCIKDCTEKGIRDSELECETLCEPIFDQYVSQMTDEYKDKPDKLLEEVSGQKMFLRKTHKKSLWQRIVG